MKRLKPIQIDPLRSAGFFLLTFVVTLSTACGSQSPTGKPGPLGPRYDAAEYYKGLKDDPATMPQKHRKNFEAVRKAVSGNTPRVKHGKTIRISDDQIRVTIRASWETVPIDGRHVILSAALEGVEFAGGTTCKAQDFKRQESSEPYFDMVSLSVNCERKEGSAHHVINRTFYWNGARAVNEPLVPNGELNIPGTGTEISDS